MSDALLEEYIAISEWRTNSARERLNAETDKECSSATFYSVG